MLFQCFRKELIDTAFQVINYVEEPIEIPENRSVWAPIQSNSLRARLGDLLRKKVNKWKRVLANFDTVIQYIGFHCGIGGLSQFKCVVDNEWIPEVTHFWFHSDLDESTIVKNNMVERIGMLTILVFYF